MLSMEGNSPLSTLNSQLFCTFAAAYGQSGCSAVGSALRSGRRGRAFESPHPDPKKRQVNVSAAAFSFLCIFPFAVHHFWHSRSSSSSSSSVVAQLVTKRQMVRYLSAWPQWVNSMCCDSRSTSSLLMMTNCWLVGESMKNS